MLCSVDLFPGCLCKSKSVLVDIVITHCFPVAPWGSSGSFRRSQGGLQGQVAPAPGRRWRPHRELHPGKVGLRVRRVVPVRQDQRRAGMPRRGPADRQEVQVQGEGQELRGRVGAPGRTLRLGLDQGPLRPSGTARTSGNHRLDRVHRQPQVGETAQGERRTCHALHNGVQVLYWMLFCIFWLISCYYW